MTVFLAVYEVVHQVARALTDLYVKERLAVLAAQDIRYIIVHKHFLTFDRLETWKKFPTTSDPSP